MVLGPDRIASRAHYSGKKLPAVGWMHTDHTTGFHFEKGPRTFKADKCPATLRLIVELGLQEELIWSEARPHHRYLWHEGEMHRFPTNPIAFLFSPITKGFLRALLTEWKKPRNAPMRPFGNSS